MSSVVSKQGRAPGGTKRRSMRRHRLGLLLLVLAVFCAACGVRVNPKLRQQAADAQLGRGGATVAAGAASGGEGSKELAGATGGAVSGASAVGGATGAAGGATGGASKGQNALGSAAPAGGN